jgi:GGDEF domain-containing protein
LPGSGWFLAAHLLVALAAASGVFALRGAEGPAARLRLGLGAAAGLAALGALVPGLAGWALLPAALLAAGAAWMHPAAPPPAPPEPPPEATNRRGLLAAAPPLIALARRARRPVSMLVIELPGLAEERLPTMATVIATLMRQSDLLSRLGPRRFAALLPDTDLDGAAGIAERLRQTVLAAQRAEASLVDAPRIGLAELGAGEAETALAAALAAAEAALSDSAPGAIARAAPPLLPPDLG